MAGLLLHQHPIGTYYCRPRGRPSARWRDRTGSRSGVQPVTGCDRGTCNHAKQVCRCQYGFWGARCEEYMLWSYSFGRTDGASWSPPVLPPSLWTAMRLHPVSCMCLVELRAANGIHRFQQEVINEDLHTQQRDPRQDRVLCARAHGPSDPSHSTLAPALAAGFRNRRACRDLRRPGCGSKSLLSAWECCHIRARGNTVFFSSASCTRGRELIYVIHISPRVSSTGEPVTTSPSGGEEFSLYMSTLAQFDAETFQRACSVDSVSDSLLHRGAGAVPAACRQLADTYVRPHGVYQARAAGGEGSQWMRDAMCVQQLRDCEGVRANLSQLAATSTTAAALGALSKVLTGIGAAGGGDAGLVEALVAVDVPMVGVGASMVAEGMGLARGGSGGGNQASLGEAPWERAPGYIWGRRRRRLVVRETSPDASPRRSLGRAPGAGRWHLLTLGALARSGWLGLAARRPASWAA
eukprot:jgi/Mesvir1/22935/Mv19448-RA.1